MLENGEDLDQDARIFMSTIHAIKGGEQDNVIISLHQGSTIQKAIRRSVEKRDEEHRVEFLGLLFSCGKPACIQRECCIHSLHLVLA